MKAKEENHIDRMFRKIPIVKNAEKEHGDCVELASFLQRETRQGRFDTVWFHVANEFAGKKRPIWGALLKAMGKLSGVADYIFMWDNGCGAIEMKHGKGKQSKGQIDFELWCHDNGVPYEVCYSSQEAINVLIKWGRIKNDT